MIYRQSVINNAREFLGVRWKHQGRTIDGIDCVGLVLLSFIRAGVNVDDFVGYSRRPTQASFLNHFTSRGCVHVKRCDIRQGDIVIFTESSYPCHTGLYSIKNGKPHIIHAHLPKRKTVEEPFVDDLKRKVIAVLTLPEYI